MCLWENIGGMVILWDFVGFVGEWAPCDQNTAKVVSINEITQMKLINFKSVDNK